MSVQNEISATGNEFRNWVLESIAQYGEVFIALRFSGGGRKYFLFRSIEELSSLLTTLAPQTSVIAMRGHFLPIRGVVDEKFILKAEEAIALPDNMEFLILCLDNPGQRASGEGQQELLDRLNEMKSQKIAVGPLPAWWDDSPETLESIVPLATGDVRRGVY